MAKRSSAFHRVGRVLDLLRAQGCEVRVAETTVVLDDGDVLNFRYVFNPANGQHVPVVDLSDDDSIPRSEIDFWCRRLGVSIDLG